MKTARQDRPALSNIDGTSFTGSPHEQGTTVDVDIVAGVRVRLNSTAADSPLLVQALEEMGLSSIDERQIEPLLHIQVTQHLKPSQDQCSRVRDNILVEPSTLWVLDNSGAVVAGFNFATWDTQISALVTPTRLNWLLRLLLPVALPTRGLLTGHGAAYQSANGRGIVMCGLPNSGKTGATLAAVARGAKFLADDLVVIDPALRQIWATTLPVVVAYSYLQQFPQYKKQIPQKTLTKLQWKTRALHALRLLMPAKLASKILPNRIAKRWVNLLNTRLEIELPVSALFEPQQLTHSTTLNMLIMLVATDTTEGVTAEISAADASRRWLLAVKKDTSELSGLLDLQQFAFPDTACNILTNHPLTVANLLAPLLTENTGATDTPKCTAHSLVVNWQKPNPDRIHTSLLELSNRD